MRYGLGLFVVSQILIHSDVVQLPQSVEDVVSTDMLGWICFAVAALIIIVTVARTDTDRYSDSYNDY